MVELRKLMPKSLTELLGKNKIHAFLIKLDGK